MAAQFGDDTIQTFDFGLSQGAGRFIHHQDAAIEAEGFGDFDQLLIADPERSCEAMGRDIAVEGPEQFGGGSLHAAIIAEYASPSSFPSQKNIGSDGKLFN